MKTTTTLLLLTLLAANAGAETNRVARFDGNGDLITVASSPDLMPASEITIEAWIYPLPSANNHSPHFLSKGDGGSVLSSRSYELHSITTNGNYAGFSIFLGSSTWAYTAAPVPASEWTHVAVTYSSDSSELRLYRNGVLLASTTNDASGSLPLNHQPLRQSTQPLVFGAYPPHSGTFTTGMLDEIRIWSVARSGSDIYRDLYHHLSGSETDLVAYWSFEDGTATDITGHGHNGTFSGDTTTVPDDGPITEVIRVAIEVASVQVSWPSHTNVMYQVQYSSALTTNTWVNFGNPVEGVEGVSTVIDSVLGRPRGFYRVLRLP